MGPSSATFEFRPMTAPAAKEIAGWHYEEPYSFYDFEADPLDLEMLLNPENWEDCWYCAYDKDGRLVGYFEFLEMETGTIAVGLGLHPAWTGKGLGTEFVRSGLEFGRSKFSPKKWSLAVATFNKRAIKVYERVGFRAVRTFAEETNGGVWEFLCMEMPAEPGKE